MYHNPFRLTFAALKCHPVSLMQRIRTVETALETV